MGLISFIFSTRCKSRYENETFFFKVHATYNKIYKNKCYNKKTCIKNMKLVKNKIKVIIKIYLIKYNYKILLHFILLI